MPFGMEMLLASVGVDKEAVEKVANAVLDAASRIATIEKRLAAIELNLDSIKAGVIHD